MLSSMCNRFSMAMPLFNAPLGYPGAPLSKPTNHFQFLNQMSSEPLQTFQIMDKHGNITDKALGDKIISEIGPDNLRKMYKTMIRAFAMDNTLYNAQRQGRFSFYMTSYGEYAIQVAAGAAFTNDDICLMQYRELGTVLYRGAPMMEYMDQCFGTKDDMGKGRQMPLHYGSSKLNMVTISSPLATQCPQAAGHGYALRVSNRPNVAFCWMGDGSASEGDVHPAMNFAATLKAQTVFICRNNGYAISTHVNDQYIGDGIAPRGIALGMDTIRVDGSDMFASYWACKQARELCLSKKAPVLIEAMAYRVGHHSTSDDWTRYRNADEVNFWDKDVNPIDRVRKFMVSNKLWTEEEEKDLIKKTKKEVLDTMSICEKKAKIPPETLITDVYEKPTPRLEEQYRFIDACKKKYPEFYDEHH